jgi:hypothetical protein
MKAKLLSVCTAILAIVAMLGGLDLSGVITLIPGGNAEWVTLISGGLATLGTIARAIGDLADDGKVNGSFGRLQMSPVTFLVAVLIAIIAGCTTSCAGLNASLRTPYGNIRSINGQTTITAIPFIIEGK